MTQAVARRLSRYAWLSIGAALTTMALKAGAAALTGSVSLLSDALESLVNLAGAVFTLWMLRVGAQPPDERHAHGHDKAEYFASGFEGLLVLVAGVAIGTAAVDRLVRPAPIESLGIALVISVVATLINFVVARVLARAGAQHNSVALRADAAHLMTDVWTTVGVLGALGLVALTGAVWLDPVVALLVGLQILTTGGRLVREAADGLMDAALPEDALKELTTLLDEFASTHGAKWHALRTRVAGSRTFLSVHLLVPGAWTVTRGHDLCERLETEIWRSLAPVTVLVHLEPIEDPKAYDDHALDR